MSLGPMLLFWTGPARAQMAFPVPHIDHICSLPLHLSSTSSGSYLSSFHAAKPPTQYVRSKHLKESKVWLRCPRLSPGPFHSGPGYQLSETLTPPVVLATYERITRSTVGHDTVRSGHLIDQCEWLRTLPLDIRTWRLDSASRGMRVSGIRDR